MQTLILPGAHAQSPPPPSGTNGGNKSLLRIISINGPIEVGPGTYSYTAPADGGSPSYTYKWTSSDETTPNSVTGDTISEKWSRTGDNSDNSVQNRTLTASITDQAGEKASKNLTIHLHPEIEIEVTGATAETDPTDEDILTIVELSDIIQTASYAASSSKGHTIGISASVEFPVAVVLKATVGLEYSFNYTTTATTTINLSRPTGVTGNYKVEVYAYVGYTKKTGTWKKWGNGVTSTGNWDGTSEQHRVFAARHVN